MERSKLIQRLNKPPFNDDKFSRLTNVLAFGGGLRNGGISEEASRLLSKVINFDYMGSAEFEFGAVPKSLNRVWDNREKYITRTFPVHYSYSDGWGPQVKKIEGDRDIWVICLKDDLKEICTKIKTWAYKPSGTNTKEPILLDASLASKYRSVGWMEIDNDFMFFSDKEMFEGMCELFEIKVK